MYCAYLPAFVRLLDIPDAHCPCLVLRVGNADPLVLGYHMVLYGENRLGIDAQPRNLSVGKATAIVGVLMNSLLHCRAYNMAYTICSSAQLTHMKSSSCSDKQTENPIE